MTDTVPERKRSWIMGQIRGTDTRPELRVRSVAHRLGYRFRLHRRDLPGKPDLVFPSRKKVVFVHGCFWHQHQGCKRGERTPASNRDYWSNKLQRNVARDAENEAALAKLGWASLTIWECETKHLDALATRLKVFLG